MTDVNYIVGRERQRELLRQAEMEREANAYLRNNKRYPTAIERMGRGLARFGSQLVAIANEKN